MADAVGRTFFTVVGSFFGPWGTLIGSLVGNWLFPQEGPQGPRINELNIQHSTVGSPIPIVYGTAVLAGNVIWSGGLVETKHEGGGGKGGPSGPTTYSYSVDVAIGICEGPIDGVRRIWADADLIYDASDDETLTERLELGGVDAGSIAEFLNSIRAMSSQLDFELYLGTEDQLPDPTIESHEVVGTVPAYRGLAYIVFPNFQLEKFGNRIPNFRFEVYTGTPAETVDCSGYSVGHLEPWEYMLNGGVFDPRNPDNPYHLYENCIEGLQTPTSAFDVALADMALTGEFGNDVSWVCGETPQQGDSEYIRGWALSSTPNYSQPCDADDPSAPSLGVDRVTVTMNLNSLREFAGSCQRASELTPDGIGEGSIDCSPDLKNTLQYLEGGDFSGFYYNNLNGTGLPPYPDANWDNRGDCNIAGDPNTYQKWAAYNQEMCVRRWHQPLSGCEFGVPLAGSPGFCVAGGVVRQAITWTRVSSGTFKALSHYNETGTFGVVTTYPIGPCIRSDNPLYNDQEFWEESYAAAVAAGTLLNGTTPLPGDWVYGVDYPTARNAHPTNSEGAIWQASCEADVVSTECVPMAAIVSDICRRAGLRTDTATQIDVTDLTSCVPGYIVGRQMPGREALQPLRMFGLWDAVESDALLKFVERAHPTVATLTTDDLGAHENGSQAPTLVEVTRIQEKELPRRVRLHFPNYLKDHEASEQSASRTTTEAVTELDIELAISMEPDTAAQLADIMLYEAWVSRNTFRFTLDNTWLGLEPTDCVELPVDGTLERARILSVDYKIGGLLQIEAVRDDDGAYVSTAVAVPGTPSGGAPGSSGGGPVCPSVAVLLDIPRLDASHVDAGYYLAVYGLCPDTWECAELYRSSDGGATYSQVARTDQQATVGEIVAISGPPTDPALPGDSPQYDEANSITVSLFNGTLASVSDAQIDAGQNLAAIGVDGRWVLIQFKTATLDSGDQWILTDLIWGLNETAHNLGTTGDGDTFVLLDSSLLRIPESASAIGVEKQFKIVTCGESIDGVTEFDFTTWGLSYERTCPSTVISATLTTPPVSPSDGDAYLLPTDTSLSGVWATHGGEISFFSDETDSWQFCTPVPGTIIHILPGDTGSGGTTDEGEDVISGGDGTYTPAPWARSTESYLTREDERATLPNSLRLSEGTGIAFTETTDGELEIAALAGGDESFITLNDESATLPNSRRLADAIVAGDNITITENTDGDLIITGEEGGGGGGGAAGEDVLGSPGTVLTVGGLNLVADKVYFVEWSLDNQTGGGMVVSAAFNGDTTATNYDKERLGAEGTVAGANHGNDNIIHPSLAAGRPLSGWAWLRFNFDGKPYIHGGEQYIETTTRGLGSWAIQHRTAANVTQFDIVTSVNMAAGSWLRIWPMGGGGGGGGSSSIQFQDEGDPLGTPAEVSAVNFVGAGVTADIDSSGIVTVNVPGGGAGGGVGGMEYVNGNEVTVSAASSITVGGLDLDADDTYFVVIRLRNTAATANTYYLTYNADTTATNYFNDNQSGGGATQGNNPFIGSTFATANNENVHRGTISRPVNRVTAEFTGGPAGNATASMRQQSVVHQWTTLGTNVTSLTISQSAGLAQIDVGSRVDVWKLTTGVGGGGGSGITWRDEGIGVGTVSAVDFVGEGVEAVQAGGTLTVNIPAGIPQNIQSANYTVLQADNGKHILHEAGAGAGDTYTWDLDTLTEGHTVTVFNLDSNSVTLAFVNGTGRWIGSGAGVTGNRTLAAYGHATVTVIDAGDEAVFDGALIT